MGAKHLTTAFTVIKELAGVGRHGFGFLMTTFRARQDRVQFGHDASFSARFSFIRRIPAMTVSTRKITSPGSNT